MTTASIPLAPTNQSGFRRRDIQGLRAIAVLMVVLFHAGLPLPGGFTGVDVFFVISGFVISGMLQRQWIQDHSISMRRFYARRFQRLTPALVAMLIPTLALAALFLSPLGTQQLTSATALGALLLVANIVIQRTTGGYFDAAAETNPLLNTWSLSVEEQFYLVFPWLILISWRLAARTRRGAIPVALVGAVTAASLALALFPSMRLGPLSLDPSVTGFYSPLARIWEFGAGALLALFWESVARRSGLIHHVLAWVGVALLALAALTINGSDRFPSALTLIPVVGAVCLIVAGGSASNPVSRLLSTQPFVAVGNFSYAWYLWHWPLIVVARSLWPSSSIVPAIAAVLSTIPAWLAYTAIEKPIHYRRFSAGGFRTLVTLTMVAGLATALIVGVGARNGWGQPAIQAVQAEVTPDHSVQASGCHTFEAPSEALRSSCVWNAGAEGSPIYLVGDSNADHLSEAVIGAGSEAGRPVHAVTISSCPVLTYESADGSEPAPPVEDRCSTYLDDTEQWLASAPAGTVVVSQSDGYQVAGDQSATLTARTREFVKALKAHGHDIVVVQTIPHVPNSATRSGSGWDPRTCSQPDLLSGACGVSFTVRQSRTDTQWQAEALVRETTLGYKLLNLDDLVCPNQECRTQVGTQWIYRDAAHITVAESASLTDAFTRVLEQPLAKPAN